MGDAGTLFGCCQFSVSMAAQPRILCLYSREGTCIESKFVKDVLCLTDTFLKLPAKISKRFSFTPKIRRCFSSLSLCKHMPPTPQPTCPTTLNPLFCIKKCQHHPLRDNHDTLALVRVFDIKTRPKQKIEKKREALLKELRNWGSKEPVKW